MKIALKEAFSKCPQILAGSGTNLCPDLRTLPDLKRFLDLVHIKRGILRPYLKNRAFPLVEKRDLLPSFDIDPYEHPAVPGFSMVAFERPLNYFQEIFQFDILHGLVEKAGKASDAHCPLEPHVQQRNLDTVRARLPRAAHDSFLNRFAERDVTAIENYPNFLKYLFQMDRAHVLAHDDFGNFHLAGVYASFPSDLDTELKRFGMRIGKFSVGDNQLYERNRTFVYQFLMELYGFPIASERRTSTALFARRLHKQGERFLVRMLGQSDRTLTTIWPDPEEPRYLLVEKIALVKLDKEQKEAVRMLKDGGYFVDTRRRAVILRVLYHQHRFDPSNIRQDRALSVMQQQVIHPVTGESTDEINLIKDTNNMFLRLNDMVRGEFTGRVVFKRTEVVENTDTHEKRLKFLYTWLSKHQRRIIGYSDEFFGNVVKVLDNYLLNPDNYEFFAPIDSLYREVWGKYSYIQQARKVAALDDLRSRVYKGHQVGATESLRHATDIMHQLKFEIVNYFVELVDDSILIGEKVLADGYLRRTYVDKKDEELTEKGREAKKLYGKLVALVDEFKAIRRARAAADASSTRSAAKD